MSPDGATANTNMNGALYEIGAVSISLGGSESIYPLAPPSQAVQIRSPIDNERRIRSSASGVWRWLFTHRATEVARAVALLRGAYTPAIVDRVHAGAPEMRSLCSTESRSEAARMLDRTFSIREAPGIGSAASDTDRSQASTTSKGEAESSSAIARKTGRCAVRPARHPPIGECA